MLLFQYGSYTILFVSTFTILGYHILYPPLMHLALSPSSEFPAHTICPHLFPSQQCYAGPMRGLRGLPVQDPYRFGRGRCSGPAWAYRTSFIWLILKSLIHNTNLRMLACAESAVTKYFRFIK